MLSLESNTTRPLSAATRRKMIDAISTLVHDLRQPLSVIEACADYLELILPCSDERTREQLQILQQQVSDANRIMHQALVLAHYDIDEG